jgi:hypothetical protein
MPLEGNQGLNPHRDAEQRRFHDGHHPDAVDPEFLKGMQLWAKAKRLRDEKLADDKAASYPKRMRELTGYVDQADLYSPSSDYRNKGTGPEDGPYGAMPITDWKREGTIMEYVRTDEELRRDPMRLADYSGANFVHMVDIMNLFGQARPAERLIQGEHSDGSPFEMPAWGRRRRYD